MPHSKGVGLYYSSCSCLLSRYFFLYTARESVFLLGANHKALHGRSVTWRRQ